MVRLWHNWQFSLLGWLLFTSTVPPIIWIVTVFDVDYRIVDPLEGVSWDAWMRAMLLGFAMGIAMITAGIGWRLMRKPFE